MVVSFLRNRGTFSDTSRHSCSQCQLNGRYFLGETATSGAIDVRFGPCDHRNRALKTGSTIQCPHVFPSFTARETPPCFAMGVSPAQNPQRAMHFGFRGRFGSLDSARSIRLARFRARADQAMRQVAHLQKAFAGDGLPQALARIPRTFASARAGSGNASPSLFHVGFCCWCVLFFCFHVVLVHVDFWYEKTTKKQVSLSMC